MTKLPSIIVLSLVCAWAQAQADPRRVYNEQSPQWLRAVGKLVVPGVKIRNGYPSNHREDCSATLVAPPGAHQADTLVSAWHCLEHYRDLTKIITFTLLSRSGTTLSAQAVRVADGGGMHADWAVLQLRQPLSLAEATALPLSRQPLADLAPLVMAGYSRDEGLGAGGTRLTYDPHCELTASTGSGAATTNCRAHKGASGGAVIWVNPQGQAELAGVISEGDGEGISTYVPVSRFRRATLW